MGASAPCASDARGGASMRSSRGRGHSPSSREGPEARKAEETGVSAPLHPGQGLDWNSGLVTPLSGLPLPQLGKRPQEQLPVATPTPAPGGASQCCWDELPPHEPRLQPRVPRGAPGHTAAVTQPCAGHQDTQLVTGSQREITHDSRAARAGAVGARCRPPRAGDGPPFPSSPEGRPRPL